MTEDLEQKVEDLEEELGNQTVVTKTPLGDMSWYIKWFACIAMIFGAMFTAAEIYPWNVFFGLLGLIGWSYVGILWNDRALIVMNVFLAGVYSLHVVNYIKLLGE